MIRLVILLAVILIQFLFSGVNASVTDYANGYRHYPHYAHYRGYRESTDSKKMSELEKYTLNRTYQNDTLMRRLQRLEMETFGAVQDGDYYTRYNAVQSAIYSRPKQNYKKTLLRNIGDYFAGQMTGFTPQIQNYTTPNNSYSYYPSTFGNTYETGYSNPWGQRYQYNNYGTGSSSGIQILD